MGLTVPVDFSMSSLGLVEFDHDKGPNLSRSIPLKHFAPKSMRSVIHGCKQGQVFELDTRLDTWQNWAQDFATVQSYELPEGFPCFPLPVFHHFSVSSADDGSKEMLRVLSPVN